MVFWLDISTFEGTYCLHFQDTMKIETEFSRENSLFFLELFSALKISYRPDDGGSTDL
jgi:hypothetical protein